MRVLVLGAAGQVGRAVTNACPATDQCVALGRGELDITDSMAVRHALRQQRVDWVINCAAYTAVDLAEAEPVRAQLINADAVGAITASVQDAGARLLHLSTDFVFDGRRTQAYPPDSETNPLSVYGRTKLAGEQQALADPSAIVLRTSWVYAASGRNFVLTMLKLMRERGEVRVVNDQFGSPTWAHGLAQVIWAMAHRRTPGGVYHWCDEGVVSWYDFAVAIHEEAGSRGLLPRPVRIVPISTREYPTQAARPAYSALDSSRTRLLAGITPKPWREQLRTMFDELRPQ